MFRFGTVQEFNMKTRSSTQRQREEWATLRMTSNKRILLTFVSEVSKKKKNKFLQFLLFKTLFRWFITCELFFVSVAGMWTLNGKIQISETSWAYLSENSKQTNIQSLFSIIFPWLKFGLLCINYKYIYCWITGRILPDDCVIPGLFVILPDIWYGPNNMQTLSLQ